MESLENQERIKYEKIIKDYLLRNNNLYSIQNIHNVIIHFKKLGGGMNKNFLIEIDSNSNKSKLFFRYFGDAIYGDFDKKKEAEILKTLGEEGYGPKLLEYDYQNEKYRIDEFLDNSRELFYEEIFEEKILKKLIILINKYSQISDIYKYELINNQSKNTIKLIQQGNKSFSIKSNIYDYIINNVYNKAKENFEKFYNDYTKSSFNDNNLNESNLKKSNI